jgi:hypothetical protein
LSKKLQNLAKQKVAALSLVSWLMDISFTNEIISWQVFYHICDQKPWLTREQSNQVFWPAFFSLNFLLPKMEIKIRNNNSNQVILEGLHHQKWGKKKVKYFQYFIFGFQCAVKNIKDWLNICTPNPIYRQIWLHLLMDDRCIGCINKFLKNTGFD